MDRDGDAREDEHDERHDKGTEAGQLHLPGLDFLAQVLGSSPDHQPADEHGESRHRSRMVQPAPHPPGGDLSQHHPGHRAEAAHRVVRVGGAVDGTVGGLGSWTR